MGRACPKRPRGRSDPFLETSGLADTRAAGRSYTQRLQLSKHPWVLQATAVGGSRGTGGCPGVPPPPREPRDRGASCSHLLHFAAGASSAIAKTGKPRNFPSVSPPPLPERNSGAPLRGGCKISVPHGFPGSGRDAGAQAERCPGKPALAAPDGPHTHRYPDPPRSEVARPGRENKQANISKQTNKQTTPLKVLPRVKIAPSLPRHPVARRLPPGYVPCRAPRQGGMRFCSAHHRRLPDLPPLQPPLSPPLLLFPFSLW